MHLRHRMPLRLDPRARLGLLRPRLVSAVLLTAPLAVSIPGTSGAGGETEAVYRLPDPRIVDIVDARRTPWVRMSPDRGWMALLERPSYPGIAEIAERELGIGGTRIRPRTSGPSRTLYAIGLTLLDVADGSQHPVTGLPEKARIENVAWSPDGKRIAFTHTTTSGIELWIVDRASAKARRLVGPRLNLVFEVPPAWMPDGASILALLIPEERGVEPPAPAVPSGPVIQESLGRTAPSRTFTDLLESPHDEQLFEHYFASQLARVDLDGHVSGIGNPGLLSSFSPSPSGELLLVETVHRPFSYLVPYYRFPTLVEVWDIRGAPVHRVVDLPLRDEVPQTRGSVPLGPRAVEWRADAPATLCWVEALDGGDAAAEAELRDALYLHPAPFRGEPALWMRLPSRFTGVLWGNDDVALVTERWWKTRNTKTWLASPGRPAAEARILVDRSFEDSYSDPGQPIQVRNPAGRLVLYMDPAGAHLYLKGEGASEEGNRPFVDRYDLAAGTATRLFRSEAPAFEDPVTLLDEAGDRLLTRRESVDEPPNYFVRDLRGGGVRALTGFPHPYPEFRGIRKELIQYPREDGVQLSATLYLPPGWSPDQGPLPTVMWAYPQEFKSADAAGQITDSPYRFNWPWWASPTLWVAQGYAVLDDPKMPVIGEGDAEPNDTFIPQLVASAKAAVDELVRRGVADPKRIAIGGHSYGAFMTANLLAHSDLFAAGLARTGAYNRTLTPFGFQSEDRTLWQAPEVYFAMSPFMHADKIDEPLLLVHGAADDNPGTFPMQSERLFNAMKGLGGTVRLVMLPHETHSYEARESILHLLWETQEWLDRYVKRRTG